MNLEELERWEQTLIAGDDDVYRRMTKAFAQKNGLSHKREDRKAQWGVVQEEIEELEEAWNRYMNEFGAHNPPTMEVLEEMADVVYTIHLLAYLLQADLRKVFRGTAVYNLQKSGERDEDGKVVDDVSTGE